MKILIVRFSSIGDIVLTTPVVRCLKKKFPDAEIHYLTKAAFHPLLAGNPHISKFYLLEDELQPLLEEMKKEDYDIGIDLHKNLRTFRVKQALEVKQWFNFQKLNFEKWLKVNMKVDVLPEKHLVDRYFEALEPLGIQDDGQGLDYYVWDKEVYEYVSQLVKASYVAMAIGAKHNTKKMTDEMVIELCGKIDSKVYVLGGKEEEALGARLNELYPAKIVNLCGKLTINESAYVVKNARKVITHDTGLMHIAAAFKKPVISVWGNTVPEFGMYPYYGKRNELQAEKLSHIMEVKGLPCRPCSKIGYEKCPRGHFKCMRDQNLDRIAELARI